MVCWNGFEKNAKQGGEDMTRRAVTMAMLMAAWAAVGTMAAEEIRPNEAPEPVRETIRRELDDYRLRNIDLAVRDGKDVYVVEGRGRQSRKLIMVIGPDGGLLEKIYEGQFSMRDGQLHIETRPFWIQSVYSPDAGDPDDAPRAPAEAISKLSYAGGNILAFDLHGLREDGSGLTDKADAFMQDVIDRLLYTKLGALCRVSGLGESGAWERAGRFLAEYFAKDNEFILWFDGDGAERAVKAFKEASPHLVAIGPGGDMAAGKGPAGDGAEKPVLSMGDAGGLIAKNAHFLLTPARASYEALDAWNALPAEKEPWTPDNSGLSESERAEGFVALFDGKTTNGWRPASARGGGFKVTGGGTLARVPGGGDMITVKRFGDFVLRFEFMIEKNGNSGVQVRCPRSNRSSKVGFEVQILGDYGRPPTPDTTGAIYNVLAPAKNAGKPAGEWNAMEITCDGPKVRVVLNGETVQDVNFDDHDELRHRLRDGFIRLTDHGAKVEYRNIRIKELAVDRY